MANTPITINVNIQPLVSTLIPFGDLCSKFGNLVRLAAFRLVEAGMETKPGIESRFRFPCIVKYSWKLGLIMNH